MSENQDILDPGFFGKLPAYGDFIQKRLPRDFISPWDDWLQQGIAAAKERLADNWLTYYLNCPAWKFVLGDRICGEQACAGVTIPSVDKVGRYFNFTLAAMLPPNASPCGFAASHIAWFNELEELAIMALGDELDQDMIDESINNLGVTSAAQLANPAFDSQEGTTRVLGTGLESAEEMMTALLHNIIGIQTEQYGLWWHGGSSQVSAQMLICESLPTVEIYLAMMMDEEPIVPAENTEVDYLDELLSS